MLPSAIVEQQSKLGVSVEDSKAQRIKRQQARFRDRGGAFVPSKSNPLIDILLARTVSGESPSKARPKEVAAKRLPLAKTHKTSSTRRASAATVTEKSHAEAGSSGSKLPTSRKRTTKVVEPKADAATKPAPKRRGKSAKGKTKVLDSDPEQPPPDKSRSGSKGKGKQRDAVPSASDEKPKAKTKLQARRKPNPAKEMVEVLVSDDDRTLVDVPHKAKSTPKGNIRYEDDDETDNGAPIVRKRASHVDVSKASGPKTATRVNIEKIASTKKSGKKTPEDVEGRSQNEKYSKTDGKKRLVMRDNDHDDDATASPAKKGKAVDSTSAKRKKATGPVSIPMRTSKGVKNEGKPKATDKGKEKYGVEPDRDLVEPMDENDDERLPQYASKPKKRKKEGNYDDRPRKVVKFSEPGPPHSSSRKLKENQSDRKHNGPAKPSIEDEPDNVPPPKLATKPPSRAKTLKGPPREVLERIKASAVRYLRCADSEPDELDCLS